MKITITPPAENLSACTLEIVDPSWTPNVTLNFEYRLLNAAGEICSPRKRAQLTPEQYAAWGSGDDAYVARCIATNVGLTPAN